MEPLEGTLPFDLLHRLLSAGSASGFYGWSAMNVGVMPLLIIDATATVWYVPSQRTSAREVA